MERGQNCSLTLCPKDTMRRRRRWETMRRRCHRCEAWAPLGTYAVGSPNPQPPNKRSRVTSEAPRRFGGCHGGCAGTRPRAARLCAHRRERRRAGAVRAQAVGGAEPGGAAQPSPRTPLLPPSACSGPGPALPSAPSPPRPGRSGRRGLLPPRPPMDFT